MSEFQIALAIGALITAIISRRLPRSSLWILFGAFSFIGSTAYYRLGYPYYPVATLFFDGCVCIAIYGMARERWELLTMRLFQCSMLISLVYTSILFFLPSLAHHWLYVVLLELANWAVLAVIAGTAILNGERAGGNSAVLNWVSGLRGYIGSLRKARPQDPWFRVP